MASDSKSGVGVRLLVIGSCTAAKNIQECQNLLTEQDFANPAILRCREAELAKWALPARKLYTGRQHCYMMNGVELLRRTFGPSSCTVRIISAGYGLVDEMQLLVPYEVTFQRRRRDWILQRASRLGIPEAVRSSVKGYECVLFLLGKEYLVSLNPPIQPLPRQRLIFITSNVRLPLDPASIIIPAGKNETRYGSGYIALKGKMFEHFAKGLCRSPHMWSSLILDETSRTLVSLLESGQRNSWVE